MPIDPALACGADLGEDRVEWDEDRVILYHLGIGAGLEPADPRELEYVWEDRLKVLPTFAAGTSIAAMLRFTDAPGVDVDPARILHGEHVLEVLRPLPARGSAVHSARITHVWDKGRAALVAIDVETRDGETGEPLVRNRFSIFARGAGGFGGDPAPAPASEAPQGPAGAVLETWLPPQAGLLYRLTGDRHPLHVDPEVAREAGFEQPILPGLCTFGAVCKAVVDELLDGDVTRVARFEARFAGVVYPGETLRTSVWRGGESIGLVTTSDRGATVLSHATLTARNP